MYLSSTSGRRRSGPAVNCLAWAIAVTAFGCGETPGKAEATADAGATDSASATPTGPACASDLDCEKLVNLGEWPDKPPAACAEGRCQAGRCSVAAKATGAQCEDGDGIFCTTGTCTAGASCQQGAIVAGMCLIGGKTCVKATSPDPANECLTCNPSQNPEAYTPASPGKACKDDGTTCTLDQCDGKGACIHTVNAATSCQIAGTCVADKTVNPDNPCLLCDAAKDTAAWSPAAKATPCSGDKLDCTLETCDGTGKCVDAGLKAETCLINGACSTKGALVDPLKPCVVCDPANAKGGTNLPEATACEAGAPCLLGVCAAGVCQNKGPKAATCYIESEKLCVFGGEFSKVNPCLQCDTKQSQVKWVNAAVDASCTGDDVACTKDGCDGQGGCIHTPELATCQDKNGPCTFAVCDPKVSCIGSPKDVTATCQADSIACTIENCDGKGSCTLPGLPTNSLCDDKIACTNDSCDAKTGCVFAPDNAKCSDGNSCTADECDGKTGCKNPHLNKGTVCTFDKLGCTDEACDAGSCKVAVQGDKCLIAGTCYDNNATSNGGCQVCKALAVQDTWQLENTGTGCESDSVSCTADACDSKGFCLHTI